MNKKAMLGWVIGIPLLVLVLIVIIVRNEPQGDGVSRAAAGRAVTLALCSGEELKAWQEKGHTSEFSIKEQDRWFVPYLDYLYTNGYADPELLPAEEAELVKAVTYGELEAVLSRISDAAGKLVKANAGNRNTPYPKDSFAGLYEQLIEITPSDVLKGAVMLYGTPLNLRSAKDWTAYTSQGDFHFYGLALDAYIDREIEVFYCGDELIWMNRIISDYVTYKNVWLMEGSEEDLLVFLGSVKREMAYSSLFGKNKLYNQVADITLKAGKLEKISVKTERIQPRVLSVNEEYLELEGYGMVELAEDFRVLKTYGQFEEKRLKDILVGYDMQEFVIAEGRICAALITRAFDAEKIRVLITAEGEDGKKKETHPSVQLMCKDTMTMTVGTESQTLPAGQPVEILPDQEEFLQGRMIFKSDGSSPIQVCSIRKGSGDGRMPEYQGQIEVAAADGGLVIVNDIYFEDYLKWVVPSEMPSNFDKEALKAQAVCARTYAYIQLQKNNFQSYGAHVDDTTSYQVYNNIESDSRTDAAVQETYGQMLIHDGKPVSAYYFSSSCGTTTDGTIWGGDSSEPHLKSVLLQGSQASPDLTDNQVFAEFIKDQDYPSYDSMSTLYRWRTSIRSDILEETVDDIGRIQSIKVTERGIGGFVKEMEITGSEGTKTIQGQDKVRSVLGHRSLAFTKTNGEEITNWNTLPSAFLTIESGGTDENGITTFYIYGGGYGHGAGMSQYGARGMAEQGKGYQEILQFFYNDVTVGELPAAD